MRILFAAYYFSPLKNIASERLDYMANYLRSHGHDVTVLTRKFDSPDSINSLYTATIDSQSMQIDRIGDTIYFPYSSKNSALKKLKKIPSPLKGVLYLNKVDVFHYGWFDSILKDIDSLKSEGSFDLVLTSYGPPISLVVGKYLSDLFSIPLIIDFRDAYITEEDKGWILHMKRRNLRKFYDSASLISYASPGIKSFHEKFLNLSGLNVSSVIALNGIVPELESECKQKELPELLISIRKSFKTLLIHAGTAYSSQDFSVFFELLKYNKDVGIVFIGLKDYSPIPDRLKNVFTIPFLERKLLLDAIEISDGLILPIWKDRYTGFSGKLFEYLYSNKPILIGPGAQEDLGEILKGEEGIFEVDSPETFDFSFLSQQISRPKYKYLRSFQFQGLLDKINNLLSND